MAAASKPGNGTTTDGQIQATPKGKARFKIDGDGKAFAVHIDRQGFRRLLQTLERLAATGEQQTFKKSGRGRRADGDKGGTIGHIVFHIED